MNRKATRLLVSAIGTKSWRTPHGTRRGNFFRDSRTEGCPVLLSPAYVDVVEPMVGSGGQVMQVLLVDAGSRWTRLEDLY